MSITLQICKELALLKNGKCLSSEYKNVSTKMKWQCSEGHIWSACFGHLKYSNSWCPYCDGQRLENPLDICKQYAISKGGECLSNAYFNNKTNLLWKCSKGHTWSAAPKIRIKGSWCPYCSKNRFTVPPLQLCQDIAIERNGKCLSTEYVNNTTKMQWQCEEGHIWEAPLNRVKNLKNWCGICSKTAKRTLEDCIKKAEENGGKCLSTEYKNNRTKMLWECSKKHIWETSAKKIFKNRWCPYCSHQISKAQKELYDILVKTYSNLDIVLNEIKIIKPFHLDIYIPALRIAIEYDGEYWHYSDWAIKNGSLKRMAEKNLICLQNNIYLLRIREQNWEKDKNDELTKMLVYINQILNNSLPSTAYSTY